MSRRTMTPVPTLESTKQIVSLQSGLILKNSLCKLMFFMLFKFNGKGEGCNIQTSDFVNVHSVIYYVNVFTINRQHRAFYWRLKLLSHVSQTACITHLYLNHQTSHTNLEYYNSGPEI